MNSAMMGFVDFVSADDVLLASLHLNFNVENWWVQFWLDGDVSGGS